MPVARATIRRATPEDALEMARLAAELGYPMSQDEMAGRLEGLLAEPRHHVVVASEVAGALLGWIHVEHRVSIEGGDRAELMGLVVDPMARRHGIGRELVDAAENWALAKGVSELAVRSNIERQCAHPFYKSLGYARHKTQHVYRKALHVAHSRDQGEKK